jgi:hypothetical protein
MIIFNSALRRADKLKVTKEVKLVHYLALAVVPEIIYTYSAENS